MQGEVVIDSGSPNLFDLVHDYDSIRGWLARDEANCLFQLAATLKEGDIVEIGSYRGRSTVALCAGSSVGAGKPVFAIEPHEEFVGIRGGKFGPNDRAAFFRNLLRTKLFPLARLVNLTSDVVARGWQHPIGLMFIDGDHRYSAVRRDFFAWKPFLLKGATVVFDDIGVQGPAKLIAEHVEVGDLEPVKIVGKLGVYRFLGADFVPLEAQKVAESHEDARKLLEVRAESVAYEAYYGGGGSYLYQPITKCACTAIKGLLLEVEGLPIPENEGERHEKRFNKFPGMLRLTPEERNAVYSGQTDTFKFVFVRDPYSRALSVYADKIHRKQDFWIQQLRDWSKAHEFELGDEISFSDFLQIISLQDFQEMDVHWRPQYREGRFGYITFDFVGHFEMLASDLTYALERIGAPESIIAKATERHNVTDASMSEWDAVRGEVRAMFARKFAIDFDTLRYPQRL